MALEQHLNLTPQAEVQLAQDIVGPRGRDASQPELEPAQKSIVVVANALPAKPEFTLETDSLTGERKWIVKKGDGGLVTALGAEHGLWVGAIREGPEVQRIMENEAFAEAYRTINGGSNKGFKIVGIPLKPHQVEHYYNGVSNQMLWPFWHESLDEIVVNNKHWTTYQEVAGIFAKAVIDNAPQGAPVIINDYHQVLTAEIIRKKRPDLKLVHFVHIPFPSVETAERAEDYGVNRQMQEQLVRGMLANDIVGFHIDSYAKNFADNVAHLVPEARVESINGKPAYIHYEGRRIKLGVYPISIDTKAFEKAGERTKVIDEAIKIRKQYARVTKYAPEGEKIIFDVGRLDPIKGYKEGLLNLREMMRRDRERSMRLGCAPELLGKFRFVQVAHDSRLDVPLYAQLKQDVLKLVDEINNEFRIIDGDFVWEPIMHFSRKLQQETELLAWYKAADVMRVTPLIDGMNLVAKEWFAVGREDGPVMILSTKAGAYKELKDMVLGVDPENTEQVIEALRLAILSEKEGGLSLKQRIAMKTAGHQQVRENDVHKWMQKILADAAAI